MGKTNYKTKKSGKKGNSKKYKRTTEEVLQKSLKHSTGFMLSLLINIILVFLILKIFVYSFNFAYNVFSDVAYIPGTSEYVVVEIPADSSILQIGEALEEGGVIENKYVFVVKTKIKGYGSALKSGKFGLSASMKYSEIYSIICYQEEEEE